MGILELQKVFQLFGTVEHVQIARSGTSSMCHGKRIPQRRFAFVQFAQAKDAQQAKERLSEHHKMLRANISYSMLLLTVQVDIKSNEQSRAKHHMFLSNMNWKISITTK